MHQRVDTSEHPIVVRDVARLDAARRPGSRPTEYWALHHVLAAIDEDMITGLGAATEIPAQRVA